MRTTHSVPRWRPLLDAALITLFVLALFFHWFGLANRYVLFLYGHSAPGIPLTQPFDAMTASRYWMSGLVAAGAVLLLYVAANWLGGRFAAQRGRSFGAPSPWSVWGLCDLPLAVVAAATTLAGLAVALPAGRRAAERPGGRYISDAPNFFAVNQPVQLLAFLVAAGLAVGATAVRNQARA